jgi:hypothetical protein
VGLRPLACWEIGFEYSRGHGYLSVVSVVCCQVEVRSLVQGSPTKRGVSECDREVTLIRRPGSTVGTCLMEERNSYSFHDIVTLLSNLSLSRQLRNFKIYNFQVRHPRCVVQNCRHKQYTVKCKSIHNLIKLYFLHCFFQRHIHPPSTITTPVILIFYIINFHYLNFNIAIQCNFFMLHEIS